RIQVWQLTFAVMRHSLLVFIVWGIFSTAALAQTGVADGSIKGIIRDPSGSAVGGARINARNTNTGFERATTSGAEGEFEAPLLPPGPYEIAVMANGFAEFHQTGIIVQLARSSSLDLTLQLVSVNESVTVQADASILTVGNTDVGGTLNSNAML